jgi:uncharacterized membrane protein YidH (DUF202 family)
MIYDSLTNDIMIIPHSVNPSIPPEFEIFGENSVAYNIVSEITEAKSIDYSSHYVKSGVAVGLSIYFLLILLFLKGRILSLGKMFSDYRFTKKQYEETSRISAINTSFIILFTITVVSIQFSIVNNFHEYKMTIVSFLSLLGIFLLQSATLRLVALICKTENILGEVNLNRKLYLSVSGMIILPAIVLTLLYRETDFGKITLLISEILFGILILLMMIRLLRVLAEAKVSYFFRFLYLCTFEISPYLALFIVFENIN